MTRFWSTDLNPNESDDTFALVEQTQKRKKHPGICLVVCQSFLLSFIINSMHLPILKPFLFFIYKAYTWFPAATASHHEPGFWSSLFHPSCHLPHWCSKHEKLTEQLAIWSNGDTASSFYLNAPSIWAPQISIDQYTMAKWCDTNNKRQTLIAAKITRGELYVPLIMDICSPLKIRDTSVRGKQMRYNGRREK